jgi:hypothetical protein
MVVLTLGSTCLVAGLLRPTPLNSAIVGGGPSGLLLAHRLLESGGHVHILESRSDPRMGTPEGRAYALGLGMRGRFAVSLEPEHARPFPCGLSPLCHARTATHVLSA